MSSRRIQHKIVYPMSQTYATLFLVGIWMISIFPSQGFIVLPVARDPCECQSDSSAPVCGTNGRTYDNFCRLRCDSRFVPSLGGKCRGSCPCPVVTADSGLATVMCELADDNCPSNIPKGQVCGTDNVTYADSCKFMCAQQSSQDLGVQCGGACPCPRPESPCSKCPEEYRPICGNNGITYGNQCMFACARISRPGVFPSCRRECPCVPVIPRTDAEREAAFRNHLKQAFLVTI